jgi:CDGSH-type Zn-finger protein
MTQVEIKARENGPYLLSGPLVLIDTDGNESQVEGTMVALCRCGGSQKKPFCDGTHKKINFEAAGATVRQAQGTR